MDVIVRKRGRIHCLYEFHCSERRCPTKTNRRDTDILIFTETLIRIGYYSFTFTDPHQAPSEEFFFYHPKEVGKTKNYDLVFTLLS